MSLTVDSACFKHPDNNYCFHWGRGIYDGAWMLYAIDSIKSLSANCKIRGIDAEHYSCNDIPRKGCYNPWNLLVDYPGLKAKIRTGEPKQNNETGVITSMTMIDSTATLITELKELIGADCWVVFTRDDDHNPIKNFYNLRTSNTRKDPARDNLLNDVSPLLASLNNQETVVILLGWRDFVDVYFKRVCAPEESPRYIMTRIEYTKL